MADPLSGATALHAAALFQVLGEDVAEVFFSGLTTNKIAVVTSNREVVDRVAAGEFTIGVTDSRDFEAAAKEGKPIGAVFPDQQSYGTLIVPSALVLMANGPNPEQGRRFIDFLLRSEIQKLLGPTRETLTGSNIKPMEIDYVKLVAQAKELSRGFLKEWVDKQK
jgi:iron(III) transport system substrate-binding protein